MSASSQLRVALELEVGADPIRGSLETGGRKPRPFWGWLQLIQAIEDAITNPPGGSHEDHDSQSSRSHRR